MFPGLSHHSMYRRALGPVIQSSWISPLMHRKLLHLKRSVPLLVVPKRMKMLNNFVPPASSKDKSYNDLVATMDAHLHPKSSNLKYRYELMTACCKLGEPITAFVTCP